MDNQLWVILSTLLFMGAAVGTVVLTLTLLGGLVFRRTALARGAGILLAAGGGGYLLLLLLASLLGKERTIPAGEEKVFCEIDCHLAYSVTGVRTAKELGTGASRRTAAGTFYLVTVQTRFDERTISKGRPKDAPLTPNPRAVAMVDGQGRTWSVSEAGEAAARSEGLHSEPLSRPLIPGESYHTLLVFDLPADADHPRLALMEDVWPVKFIIGHENSLLHRRTLLALPGADSAALTSDAAAQ